MGLHIIVTGNPVHGFFFYGPFKTYDHAEDWAIKEDPQEEWWVTPLASPDEER